MLEIRNLSKTYYSKTGESVKALDNISINFAESGMVFILGKSGSGKSTLLNVMGGLDSYDSGEFIIKGKSSKEFGGSDFDAYRNTFIGFIFQEYNVLDDFTVGANIGLALELQGKKATDEKINEILAKVDLLTYAKRKPNELSGGQKQRVAIARALVKEPQIIMADEPTGALDSNTGKQIFDTLKELSREKLVLIVSHDRDFAEKYADRIIELSDGRIISDVTKHERESVRLSEGVEQVTENILRIKGGYTLTANDLMMINNYLANNNGDILLSSDGKVNSELRSAAGIGANGNTAVFEGTTPERDVKLKEYDKSKTNFIHSRLPMKNAVKIGASGLKHKKFRLVMTILLSFIAFAMFGFADTLAAYNKWTAAKESIMDSNIKNASVELGVRVTTTYSDGDEYVGYNVQGMNDADIQYLKEQTGLDFVPVYTGSVARYGNQGGFSVATLMKNYQQNNVYTGKLTGLVSMSAESISAAGLQVTGRLPEKTGEIAITELMYRQFNEYGFRNDRHNEHVDAKSLSMNEGDMNSIIGKHLTVSGGNFNYKEGNGYDFVIVGVIDTQFDYDRYASFMPAARETNNEGSGLVDMVLGAELGDELNYGFHALGYTTVEDILSLSSMAYNSLDDVSVHMYGHEGMHYIGITYNGSVENEKMEQFNNDNGYIDFYSTAAGSNVLSKLDITWFDGKARDRLGENEILIPRHIFDRFIPSEITIAVDEAAIGAKVDEMFGPGRWAETATYENTFASRIKMAAGLAHIDAVLADSESLEEFIQYRDDPTGEIFGMGPTPITNKEEARAWWINYWYGMEEQSSPANFTKPEHYKSRYEVEENVLNRFNGFMAELIGVDIPEAYIDRDYWEFTSALDNMDSENNLFHVSSSTYSDIFRRIEAYKNVDEKELLKNERFNELLLEYYDKDSWGDDSEEYKKNLAYDYYANTYLSDSELGYEKNEFGGKSGSELWNEGLAEYQKHNSVDFAEIAKLLDIESYTENYELGTTSVIKNYDFNIVGCFSGGDNNIIISDTIINDYNAWYIAQAEEKGYTTYVEKIAEHDAGIWAFAVAPMSKDASVIEKLVNMSYDDTAELKFSMRNSVMNTLDNFNDFIEVGAKVFLYVGIGFAVFAALLLMNFIATSISYKKREIGVLRAVGARSSDVFKIFFSEALIIAIINFILALAALIAAVIVANTVMHNEGIQITLLSLGIRQIALMLGVSVFVAGLSSFLPVYSIAKRKPIDAIRDK